MYGFIGAISSESQRIALYSEPHKGSTNLIKNETKCENFQIKRLSIDKFANDKVFYENEEFVIVVEGVIYNFRDLEKEYGIIDRGTLLETIYKNSSAKDLANILNGFYSMMLYDKKHKKLILITDHISYKPLWYFQKENIMIFSTDIHWLYKTINESGFNLELEYDGIYCLLNYGYMLGDITPVKNCKKLLAGNIVEYEDNHLNLINYYTIPDAVHQKEYSIEQYNDALAKIDVAFENAVRNVYEKDNEYGYQHCITLSGGLDSRAVLFMSNRLGYKTLCMTMGESNCNDIKISSKICHDLKMEHIIYELDSASFMLDIDSAIEANGATILYPGFAHTYRMKSLFKFDDLGAAHSGDMGDLILGGSLIGNQEKIDLKTAMYGSEYIDGFSEQFKEAEKNRYMDTFRFNYYNRGLNSAGNGCLATHYFTECGSPFLDRNLCDVCFSIPESIIEKHKTYIDYLKKYLPDSCKYIWEKTGCKPDAGKLKKYLIRWKQRIQFRIFKQYFSMNPFEKWYHENPSLKNYFDDIFKQAKAIQRDNAPFYDDLAKRFRSSRVMDKSIACEIVAFINKYNVKL